MFNVRRVYADTSVFGGVFDEDFADASRAFFEEVKAGRFRLITSGAVIDELAFAPNEVQQLLGEILPLAEVARFSAEAVMLQQSYLQAGIVTPKYAIDALHVAFATVMGCSLIVSWNFRHIVHFEKIPLYNAVNILNGWPNISIYSPLEVQADEKEEEI